MIGKIIFGRYEITKQVKDTNFCEIYLAKDGQLLNNDLRVVKCLKQSLSPPLTPQQAKHCLKTESQILNSLKHGQIPELFHISSEEDSEFYLVQDYIEGHNVNEPDGQLS